MRWNRPPSGGRFFCAPGILRMTTRCRWRPHPCRTTAGGIPIGVAPSTRRARLDATASTVRFLAQFGLCGAKNRLVAARNFGAADSLRRAPRRAARTSCNLFVAAHAPCHAFRGMPKTRHFSFVPAAAGARVAFALHAMDARLRFVRGLAAPGPATKIRRGLLTVEKTVIRFRPKQTVPARTSEPNQREKRQYDTDLRPDDRQGGRRRFLRENASTSE